MLPNRRSENDDPFAEFDGRTPRRGSSPDADAEAPFFGLFSTSLAAGQGVGRRLASASAQWVNDPRRWVRLGLAIYLLISIFVLSTILHGNRRMSLLNSGCVPASIHSCAPCHRCCY